MIFVIWFAYLVKATNLQVTFINRYYLLCLYIKYYDSS